MYDDRTEEKKENHFTRERERWENIQEMLEFRAKRKIVLRIYFKIWKIIEMTKIEFK